MQSAQQQAQSSRFTLFPFLHLEKRTLHLDFLRPFPVCCRQSEFGHFRHIVASVLVKSDKLRFELVKLTHKDVESLLKTQIGSLCLRLIEKVYHFVLRITCKVNETPAESWRKFDRLLARVEKVLHQFQ